MSPDDHAQTSAAEVDRQQADGIEKCCQEWIAQWVFTKLMWMNS